MELFHGSEKIVSKPAYGLGSAKNDYGRGFYCAESEDMAKEWACKNGRDGFANHYILHEECLTICDLNSDNYNILNWLALLTKYRGYWQQHSIAEEAKDFLQEQYLPDLSGFDVIKGYRADDSYFSFAQDFISGTISLQKLSYAMRLGKLGEQIVLKSEKAFDEVEYVGNALASAEEYYLKKTSRDLAARKDYRAYKQEGKSSEEIYILDILRGDFDADSLRL